MKLYYLFLLVMFLLMGCTNSSNTIGTSKVHGDVYSYVIDGHEYIKLGNGFAHSGTCKKCKTDLESIIRKVVKEERSQW